MLLTYETSNWFRSSLPKLAQPASTPNRNQWLQAVVTNLQSYPVIDPNTDDM